MKKQILILLSSILLLSGCNSDTTNDLKPSDSDSSIIDDDTTKPDTDPDTDPDEGGDSDTDKFDTNLVGTWYVRSSSNGVVPVNLQFVVYDNNTAYFRGQTFTLAGLYAGYDDVYKFTYGYYQLILQYDYESKDEEQLNYAYKNGSNSDEYDFGYCAKTEYKPIGPAYEGSEWPMESVNEYLGTSGSIPQMESTNYVLTLFNSAIYDCKSAEIDVCNSTLTDMKNYISLLLENGYYFYNYYESKITTGSFVYAYDSTQTYSFRIINKKVDNEYETEIFVYPYNEEIKPSTSSN